MLGSGTKSMRTERHNSKLISPRAKHPQHCGSRSMGRVLDEAIATNDRSPTGLYREASTSLPLCLDTTHTIREHPDTLLTNTCRATHTYQH